MTIEEIKAIINAASKEAWREHRRKCLVPAKIPAAYEVLFHAGFAKGVLYAQEHGIAAPEETT